MAAYSSLLGVTWKLPFYCCIEMKFFEENKYSLGVFVWLKVFHKIT